MNDVHFRLIGKRAVDFLLELIELNLLGVAVEVLRANIDWKLAVTRWSQSTKLTYVGSGYYCDRLPCPGSIPGAGHSSRYATSHPSQLSLAIPSWVGAMSTSQRAVTPCSWE